MSLDPITYRAFQEELIKMGAPGGAAIAGRLGGARGVVADKLRGAGRTVKNWVREGWDDPMREGMVKDPLDKRRRLKGWDWWGKGKYTRYMPVGGKSVFVGLTAPAIPGAISKEDPYGMGRSRAERAVDLSANVVGGLAGGGAAINLPMKGWKGPRAFVGGIGGAMLAARLATMPWRRQRARQEAAEGIQRPAPQPEEDPQAQARSMGLRGLGQV